MTPLPSGIVQLQVGQAHFLEMDVCCTGLSLLFIPTWRRHDEQVVESAAGSSQNHWTNAILVSSFEQMNR
jgi:hypothetical protein